MASHKDLAERNEDCSYGECVWMSSLILIFSYFWNFGIIKVPMQEMKHVFVSVGWLAPSIKLSIETLIDELEPVVKGKKSLNLELKRLY